MTLVLKQYKSSTDTISQTINQNQSTMQDIKSANSSHHILKLLIKFNQLTNDMMLLLDGQVMEYMCESQK